jgi:hypothetical protein
MASPEPERPIAFYPALVSLIGDHASAAVFCQILYWNEGRLRVVRKGQYWLAKSRAEMCKETAITLDQYKRIMPLLVKLDLIRLERGLFKNKVTPMIQLTEKGRNALHRLGPLPTPTLEDDPANPLTESTTESTDRDRSCVPFDDQDHRGATGYRQGDPGEEEERVQEGREVREVEEVQEQSADVKHDTIQIVGVAVQPAEPKKRIWMKAEDILKAHKGPPHGNLGAYWKSQCEVEYGGFQKALTGKECGQLKQLHKSLGEETRPVISYVISHWWKFASRAAASAGISSWPADPHIGFLLKHHAVAVNLLSLKQALPPPAAEPLPPPAINCSGAEEQPYVPSPQELTELLDGLKSP